MLKDSQKEEHLLSLRNQMQYESTMKAERDKSKFGTIDKGFFDGFGKSCR